MRAGRPASATRGAEGATSKAGGAPVDAPPLAGPYPRTSSEDFPEGLTQDAHSDVHLVRTDGERW